MDVICPGTRYTMGLHEVCVANFSCIVVQTETVLCSFKDPNIDIGKLRHACWAK